MTKPTARAVGYRRVSTEEQRESGLGLAAQTSAISAAADRLGLRLAETFTDAGLSGALPLEDRPALVAAIGALRRGDVLLVAKRDRLGRDVVNVALAERLAQRRGARIVSAAGEGTDDDGPTGVLLRTIIDAFAQHERLIIAQRTRAALAEKRRRGERVSRHAPSGYAFAPDGKRLVLDPREQRIIARARQLRDDDGRTLAAIAAELNRAGWRTRRGSPWSIRTVFGLLRGAARQDVGAAVA